MSLTQRTNTLKHAHVPRVKKPLIIADASPVADLGGGAWGSMESPFGLDLVQRRTGDRLTGTPPVWVKN